MSIERRRYAKVSLRIHGDEGFRRLSKPQPNAQSLWLRLVTAPERKAIPGLIPIGEAGLAEKLGWPLRAFRRCFAEIEGQNMAHADWDAMLIWLPNAVNHNHPESPNVLASWRVGFDEIPDCDLKRKALEHMEAFVKGLGEAFQKAWDTGKRQPLGKPLREALGNKSNNKSKSKSKSKREGSAPPAPPPEGVKPEPQKVVARYVDRFRELSKDGKSPVLTAKDAGALATFTRRVGTEAALEAVDRAFSRPDAFWLKRGCPAAMIPELTNAEAVSEAPEKPRLDWEAECSALHNGECGSPHIHHTRKTIDAKRSA